jgi:hypothetical protein
LRGEQGGDTRAVARESAQLDVEHGEVEACAVVKRGLGRGAFANAGHDRAGGFQGLQDIECDQELIVAHETTFAGDEIGCIRYTLAYLGDGTFSPVLD